MHVYRYRSPGLLSQKELLYDEWYFSSREELNDPIDMQSKFEFPEGSEEAWFRVLTNLWKGDQCTGIVASYLSKLCPISYEQLFEHFDLHNKNIFEQVFKARPFTLGDFGHLKNLLSELRSFLSLYEPNAGYSVSLSKANNEMLMWSHYAASHKGYCLIYRPINGYLHQCPKRKKESISTKECVNSIGSKFKVENIEYENHLEAMDAFTLLPIYHTGYSFESEEERLNYHLDAQKQLLTKNKCWDYEAECRLLLPQPSKWVSGQSTYNSYQRLFYYDFSQVVGVIFGSRMEAGEKETIKNILNGKLYDRMAKLGGESSNQHVFDFFYQQAQILPSSRVVKIADVELFSMGEMLSPGSDYYERQLQKWENFEGITIKSGKYNYDPIL